MSKTYDLSDFSDEELNTLIEEATMLQNARRESRERERPTDKDGSKGQDVKDPDHGAIPTPTPRDVKDAGRGNGVPD